MKGLCFLKQTYKDEKVGEEKTAKYFVRGKVDGKKERRKEGCIDGRKGNDFIHLDK